MWAGPEWLLIGSVAAIGVLHTMVPDHWIPITLVARQRSWSKGETARAALVAGTGHVLSTLIVGAVVWLGGVALVARFGGLIDSLASTALIVFGGWTAFSSWGELRADADRAHGHGHGYGHAHDHHGHHHDHGHSHSHATFDNSAPGRDPLYAPLRGAAAALERHVHVHRHGGGAPHAHWHDHMAGTAHAITADFLLDPPFHEHRHKTTARTALLIILGSSPMVEGIPAFFAAGRYGAAFVMTMSAVFAAGTSRPTCCCAFRRQPVFNGSGWARWSVMAN
jgi:hypothetical protein